MPKTSGVPHQAQPLITPPATDNVDNSYIGLFQSSSLSLHNENSFINRHESLASASASHFQVLNNLNMVDVDGMTSKQNSTSYYNPYSSSMISSGTKHFCSRTPDQDSIISNIQNEAQEQHGLFQTSDGFEDSENESYVRPDKRNGRRKIKIEFIEDRSKRNITFSKRRTGIMKKAYELSTLTGTQVLLLVASESGHIYTFATPKFQPIIVKPEGKNLIQECLNKSEGEEKIEPGEKENTPSILHDSTSEAQKSEYQEPFKPTTLDNILSNHQIPSPFPISQNIYPMHPFIGIHNMQYMSYNQLLPPRSQENSLLLPQPVGWKPSISTSPMNISSFSNSQYAIYQNPEDK